MYSNSTCIRNSSEGQEGENNVHIACVQMCLELIMTLSKHKMTGYRVNDFDRDLLTLHNKTNCKTTKIYELNKLTLLPMCGFIAQLVEHRTGIAEVMGSNPVEALIFFQASSFQLLKLENLLR